MWQTFFQTARCPQEKELRRYPELVHRALATMWPDGEKDERMLWAWTKDGILVRTHKEIPLMVRLLMVPGMEQVMVGQPDVRPFDATAKRGQHYRFEIDFAASKSEMQPFGERGKKRWIADIRGLMDWLEIQGARHGFDVDDFHEVGSRLTHLRPGRRAKRIQKAHATGQLVCTDATKLEAALCRGLGRGKAWGCGMLRLKEGI